MSTAIYLDYNATTPIDPKVQSLMIETLSDSFGNSSSSTHVYGWKALNLLKEARRAVARLIQAQERSIIFNSGATESNNTILRAVAESYLPQGCHIITSQIEHKCILKSCEYLESMGCKISYLPTDSSGRIQVEMLPQLIEADTRLISIMAANNETGVIQDIEKIAEISREHGILCHFDAAQWIGKLPLSVKDIPVDFLSFSSHKFYGPKGVGAIYAKDLSLLRQHPLIHGGGQEQGIRSGTINLPGVVGFGEAARLARKELADEGQTLTKMKYWLASKLTSKIPSIVFNGNLQETLPGVVNFYIPGLQSKELLSLTRNDLAMSTGSACTSVNQEPSHVLSAMGVSRENCQGSIRLSFGRFTTMDELIKATDAIQEAYETLLAPVDKAEGL